MHLDPNQLLRTADELHYGYLQAIAGLKFHDVHVHDMPLCMQQFAIQGLLEAAAYHYLEGEGGLRRRLSRSEFKAFRALSAAERVAFIIKAIGGKGELLISTAAAGIYRTAKALGIPVERPIGEVLRDWTAKFGTMPPKEYRDVVFGLSRVTGMTSTQSIFVEDEARLYLNDSVLAEWDPRYDVGIRCDELLRKPMAVQTVGAFTSIGAPGNDVNDPTVLDRLRNLVRHFKLRFDKVTKVRYLSLSMGAEDRFFEADGNPSSSRFAVIMREVIIPLSKEFKIPVFIMPYVKRGLNSVAGPTGDCVVHGPIDDLKVFVAENHDVPFILTGLHPSLNYDFCFLARACPNVRIVGFWWGNLNSVYVRAQIEERFEFIGLGWTGLNSDARITDQILYKWPDYLDDLGHVLVKVRLPQLVQAGVPVTVNAIRATVETIQSPDEVFWSPA